MTSLSEKLVALLTANEDGLSGAALNEHFGENYVDLAPIINDMLRSNRLQLLQQGNGNLIYKLIHESKAIKFEGLGYDFF